MSNVFTSVVKQHWENAIQDNLEKTLIAMELAEVIDIPNGTTKNLPRVSFQATVDYTKYTDVVFQDIKTGNDQLVIDTTPMVPFEIDELDVEDNYLNMTPLVTANAGYKLKERLEGDFLAQVLNATFKYDNAGFGRNEGTLTPVALVTGASQNVSTVFGMAKAGLTNFGADASKLALVVDSFTLVALTTLGLSVYGDKASESYSRGFRGDFGGMKVYEASNLTSTTVLDLATNPSNGDTVTIQLAKFTFVTTLGTTAGNVLIGASADASAQNLVAAVNGAAGAGTTYVDLDTDERVAMQGITATDGTDLVSFVSKRGAVLASSTMTNASNDFRAQAINAVIMEKGTIKMALRDSVRIKNVPAQKSLVERFMVWSRYGLLVPKSGKNRMIRVVLESLPAEA